MAYVKIEGIVSRTIGENGVIGFEMEETVTNPMTGQSWPVKWTVWEKGTTVKPGDMVEAKGEFSLKNKLAVDQMGQPKRNERTNDFIIYTDRNINTPEVKVLKAAAVQLDAWGNVNALPEVEPF